MRDTFPLYRQSLRGSARALLGWSVGFVAALLLYVPLYSSIGGSSDTQALIDSLPPSLISALNYDSIATGAGYVSATFYGLVGFALITIAATLWGVAAIAGDEEAGSLELTLAHSTSRSHVVLERSAAIATRLLWLSSLSAVVILALNDSAGLKIEPANLIAEALAQLGLALVVALVGVAVGALSGRRSWSVAASAGVAVIGYAVNAAANQSPDLDWLHAWSPFAWAFGNSPLGTGPDWSGLGLLYGTSTALLVIALVAFNRRDITG